jgi:hypothetical protein
LLNYGLSLAEPLDYLAIGKANQDEEEWSSARGKAINTVRQNVSVGQKVINTERLDATVSETADTVTVVIKTQGGVEHECPFDQTINIAGSGEATLTFVYEYLGTVRGYYENADGDMFEATVFGEGLLADSLGQFDVGSWYDSSRANANNILWSQQAADD